MQFYERKKKGWVPVNNCFDLLEYDKEKEKKRLVWISDLYGLDIWLDGEAESSSDRRPIAFPE